MESISGVIWSEMGPYGSIWLDTAAKMIVRALRIFFVFKRSLKIMMALDFLSKQYVDMEFGLKWVHMARYELILRLDGALWLRIISKPLLTQKKGL